MIKQAIIPAIIPDSYEHLKRRLVEVEGVARTVQVDVMDGTYTDSHSWPYVGAEKEVFETTRQEAQGLPYWQDFDIEIDLMVREPEKHISSWVLAGATRIIVHAESTNDLASVLTQCGRAHVESAIAIMPDTDIAILEAYMQNIVFVQCMGNNHIGHHGVQFDERVYTQIEQIHTRWPDLLVGVDIGVNKETLPKLCAVGARRFAAGSAVYGRGEVKRAIQDLTRVTEEACVEK